MSFKFSIIQENNGGGPLHFAFTVTEDSFDEISEKFKGGMYFTRGLYGKKGKGRALFITDPDSNEKGNKYTFLVWKNLKSLI